MHDTEDDQQHAGGTLAAVVRVFLDHCRHGRGLSEQTVRAYRADLDDLVAFAAERQVVTAAGLTLEVLRDWLWAATERGLARSTIARRSASVRAFTRWASETGVLAVDPGEKVPRG